MAETPNVLLFFTDQHRLSAVGAYGETPCRTPTLDRLAAEGVRFENAYTTCPVCSPARGTVMTGLFPHAHGVVSNVHNTGCNVNELPDQPGLLSRRLGAAGYACGYTGKWHLGTDATTAYGAPNTPSLPRTVGFEGQNFPGHGGGGHRYPEYQQYLADRGLTRTVKDWSEPARQVWPSGEEDCPVEATVPYFLAEHTIGLIDRFRAEGRSFFIWHNNWGPHGPYYAPAEFIEPYRSVEIPPWPNADWPARSIPGPHHVKIHPDAERVTWVDWAAAVRYYYAFTTLIDAQIGRVIEHLDQTGALENTILIFTADHGETIGSHGGLADKGWHHFEEIQRIPWIVRFPDGRYAGTVIDPLVSLADLYPTICEMAGADCDADRLHGRSLLPLMADPACDWRDQVVVEFGGVNSGATTMRTLRTGRLKYGWNIANEDELYDLAADPHETVNLVRHPDYQDALADCRRRLRAWMHETGDGPKTPYRDAMRYAYGPDWEKDT